MKPTAFWRKHGHWFIGAAVVLAGWGLTYGLVEQQRAADAVLAEVRFTEEVRSSTDALSHRITAYTEVTAGLRDLFLVNPYLRFDQFQQVSAVHNVSQSYGEIRSLSFVRRVPRPELPDYVQRMQEQAMRTGLALPDMPTIVRDEYFLLEYLWPLDRNESVWGLDLATQPNNLTALLAGRTSGQATISAPFILKQGTEGFLLRLPVFLETAQPWGHPDEREFLGSVGTSIDVSAMLESLEQQGFFRGVAVQIRDIGTQAAPPPAPTLLVGQSSNFVSAERARHLAPQIRIIKVHDRRWRLAFLPTQAMLSPVEQMLPWWMAVGGTLAALLLGVLTGWTLRRHTAALAVSEAHFLAVFNQATVGMALTDARSGHLLRTNRRYAHILGYTEAELHDKTFQELLEPEDLPAALQQHQRLLVGEIREYHLEQRMRHKNGRPVWVEVNISPMWAIGQAPTYHLAVIQDITERRQMQETLRDREEQQRNILRHLPIGVSWTQENGTISYLNPHYAIVTGYDAETMPDLATWWEKAYPDPAVREQAHQEWDSLAAQARAGDGLIPPREYRITDGAGKERILEISGVQLGNGQLVVFQDLTQRRAAEEKITYLEYYDALTRLPNRRQLLITLQHTLARSAEQRIYGAVLMLDIDHFKTVNEVKGHECGDALLQQVAERLRSSTHERHTVARHGDDEFVVLLENLSRHPGEAVSLVERIGQRILEVFRAPFLLHGEPHHTTASIGIALFLGQELTAEELLKRADLAMYQAKTAGRDTLQFYSPNMHTAMQERVQLEAQMRTSLEQGHFELFYQPQVHARKVIGCEALLRWRHPERGLVSPALFIPLAEDSGQILALGNWVLHTACAQLAAWSKVPLLAGLSIAINVSPRQFHQPDFVQQVLGAVAQTGADPRYLELELTESLLLQDVEDTIDKMLQLKRHGIAFSLDDFGTGYSSLAYLKRLPLDQLKIDQGFVRDVLTDANDAAIARTVVALGTSLGLDVIAEGVETAAQRDFLESNGCHIWQGYYFSRPLPAPEFADWIAGFSRL
ncbi:Uncharacterised protein [uncultured Comamonas sp.]|nr:Uncharacterised protein [uncultured Comamonas sp.]